MDVLRDDGPGNELRCAWLARLVWGRAGARDRIRARGRVRVLVRVRVRVRVKVRARARARARARVRRPVVTSR